LRGPGLGGILPQKQELPDWDSRVRCLHAVQGWTALEPVDPCAVSGAEHRSRGRKQPEGARRWIAAPAQQYRDVLSAQPGRGEKRRAPGRADARPSIALGARPFWLLFGAMPKSSSFSRRLSESLCSIDTTRKMKSQIKWIPAFAGMTSREKSERKTRRPKGTA